MLFPFLMGLWIADQLTWSQKLFAPLLPKCRQHPVASCLFCPFAMVRFLRGWGRRLERVREAIEKGFCGACTEMGQQNWNGGGRTISLFLTVSSICSQDIIRTQDCFLRIPAGRRLGLLLQSADTPQELVLYTTASDSLGKRKLVFAVLFMQLAKWKMLADGFAFHSHWQQLSTTPRFSLETVKRYWKEEK